MVSKAFLLVWAAALVWMLSRQAHAADPLHCLTPEQRRAAIANHQAVPLGRAIRAMRGRVAGEVVGARLCESAGGLVYMLTVLARDGKVTRATVDAVNGNLLGGR
jgi:uncharacterized membrane protein YkoI